MCVSILLVAKHTNHILFTLGFLRMVLVTFYGFVTMIGMLGRSFGVGAKYQVFKSPPRESNTCFLVMHYAQVFMMLSNGFEPLVFR